MCTRSTAGLRPHLRGMFAFAIWDARRDATPGPGPVRQEAAVLRAADGGFRFASEIKRCCSTPTCRASWTTRRSMNYLTYGYVPAPRTIFQKIL